jgi:hypothetical protein
MGNPMKNLFLVSLALILIPFQIFSQTKTNTHFMGSSLIFMPSTEDIGEKNLVFRFNHRFGNAKSGFDEFYGLDQGANTQLALDYGLTDKWMIGVARASQFKTWEVRSKYRLITQDAFPFTLNLYGVVGQETSDQSYTYSYFNRTWSGNSVVDSQINRDLNTYTLTDHDKKSLLGSLLISRKFSDSISLQVSPMIVHRNFTPSQIDSQRVGVDIGGRFKLSTRIDFSFNAILTQKRDYMGDSYATESQKTSISGITQLTSDQINTGLANGTVTPQEILVKNILLDEPVKHRFVPLGIGLDIETGGHVFQLFVSNTRTLAQTQLLRGGDYDIMKKEFCLGFNIMRQFSFAEEKEKW